jgi:hypothetical protein
MIALAIAWFEIPAILVIGVRGIHGYAVELPRTVQSAQAEVAALINGVCCVIGEIKS